jgi:hypothetical protein
MSRCAALLALLLAAGPACTMVLSTHAFPAGTPPPVPAQATRVYAGEPPTGSYDVIGSLTVDVAGNGDEAIAELRRQAATAGADAVVRVRLTKFGTGSPRTGITGVAVRMRRPKPSPSLPSSLNVGTSASVTTG